MKSAKIIRFKYEMNYSRLGTECKSWFLFKIPLRFLLFSLLMICAAQKAKSDENDRLVITRGCNYDFCSLEDIIPKDLLNGRSWVKLQIVNTTSLISIHLIFNRDTYLKNITYLEISNVKSLEHANIKVTEIKPYAFKMLKNLEELHVHLETLRTIRQDTFYGLNASKTLNLNGCKLLYLNDHDLVEALKLPQMPSLENLFISDTGGRINLIELTSKRLLRKIDISKTSIKLTTWYFRANFFNISIIPDKICKNLEYLNMSKIHIRTDTAVKTTFLPGQVYADFSSCTQLNHLDISFFDGPELLGAFVRNRYLKMLNISGIIKANSKLEIIPLEQLLISDVFKNNQIILQCRNHSVEVLELAENSLEFIDPDALACFKNILTINLSRNKLFLMMERNSDQFAILFKPLIHLENIRLSSNGLTEIPSSLFESNINLRQIDLSSNKLQTINLSLNHFNHLDVLDLENNRIIVLDGDSINAIENLPKGSAVNLNSNPFGCSRCTDLDFVSWLAKSKKLKHDGLTCLGSKNYTILIEDALVSVQMMCDEEMKVRLAVVNMRLAVSIPIAFLAFLCIIILMVYCIRRQIRRKRRQREVEEIKLTIKENERFAVFLTYCSEDDAFVHQYVVDNLNENLKLVIGTDRNLVCEGDRHFRLGKPILDEISELLDRSDVLVAALSNKYCLSVFCRNEFQLAIYKEMPILLMLIEKIDPKNMSPSMRDIFEKKTRVLWEYEEGEYKLKPTWLNVCESIVELIDIKKIKLQK